MFSGWSTGNYILLLNADSGQKINLYFQVIKSRRRCKYWDCRKQKNGYFKVGKGRISARIPSQRIRTNTHALRLNPFGDRICEIFSTSEAGMSFEDYLDMYR